MKYKIELEEYAEMYVNGDSDLLMIEKAKSYIDPEIHGKMKIFRGDELIYPAAKDISVTLDQICDFLKELSKQNYSVEELQITRGVRYATPYDEEYDPDRKIRLPDNGNGISISLIKGDE